MKSRTEILKKLDEVKEEAKHFRNSGIWPNTYIYEGMEKALLWMLE